jgi:hypothetical protein
VQVCAFVRTLMKQWKKWWLHIHGICYGGQFTNAYAVTYQHCHSSVLEIIDINVKFHLAARSASHNIQTTIAGFSRCCLLCYLPYL